MSKSGYYDWRKRPERIKIDKIGKKILEIFYRSKGGIWRTKDK